MTWRLLWVTLAWGCVEDRKPDVFLIAVDTLRWDHVGAYNPNSPAQTPAIDALARDSVRYEEAFTPISVTGPAFASVMTGLSVRRHAVMRNLFRNGTVLSAEKLTLAEVMSGSAYKTAAFVSAFTLRASLGLNQGFDIYDTVGDKNRTGDVTASRFEDWLKVQEGSVFTWFHSFDPHGPLNRHLRPGDLHEGLEREPGLLDHIPQYQRIGGVTDPKVYEMLYARGVEFADVQVGKVIQAIKATGRYENAMIVFFSDHGEGFRERELWYDHGSFAHVEQMRVPLLVKMPGGKRAGDVDTRLASLMDIAPTVTEVAGIQQMPDVDGRSLLQDGGGHEALIAESSHCKRVPVLRCSPAGGVGKELAVRTKHSTVVASSRGKTEKLTRYDRLLDPKEWVPLDVENEESVHPMLVRERTDRRTRTYKPLPDFEGSKHDPDAGRLKALGYIE